MNQITRLFIDADLDRRQYQAAGFPTWKQAQKRLDCARSQEGQFFLLKIACCVLSMPSYLMFKKETKHKEIAEFMVALQPKF